MIKEWGFPLPIRLGGLGERLKLPQRGPGRSPGRKRIWCTLELSEIHRISAISKTDFVSEWGDASPQSSPWLRHCINVWNCLPVDIWLRPTFCFLQTADAVDFPLFCCVVVIYFLSGLLLVLPCGFIIKLTHGLFCMFIPPHIIVFIGPMFYTGILYKT